MSKLYDGRKFRDPNLNPCYFGNRSPAQSVFLKSCLHEKYIGAVDPTPEIEVKPGKVVMTPHQYYIGHTRDGSSFRGGWITSDAIESIARGNFDTDEHVYSKIIMPS